ncbi:MAG: hypothetical protein QOC82_3241 [Frankiaceae bacterium]|jgi:hypothetical protein|nr:hypothetical protein [Frankiaceae bacterium]
MHVVRTLRAVAIGAALLGAAVPVGASATAKPRPVVLGGTVTVIGTSPYVREVVLPRPVTVSVRDWNSTVTVMAWRGRYAGFVLQPEDPHVAGALMSIQPGYCPTVGCTPPSWAFHGGQGCVCGVASDNTTTATLPAGRYRLFLIADGAGVGVTFHLPGLHGATVVRSGSRAAVSVDAPAPSQLWPSYTGGFGGNLYSAGVSHTSSARGGAYFLLGWKVFVGAPKSANAVGPCMWRGPAGGVTVAYQYPCDAASASPAGIAGQVEAGTATGPGGALAQYATFYEAFGLHQGGPISAGGYVDTESPATEAHTLALWVDFA